MHIDGDVEVVGLRLEATAEACAAMAPLLSPPEREKAARFRAERHQLEYISTHAWLRLLVAERSGLDARDISFDEGRHGKPHIATALADGRCLSFNLSHSGALAIYAFSSDGRDVGVDVESLRPIPDVVRLSERFFSPWEASELKTFAPQTLDRAFLACWTRKEAFIKALGLGLHCPLDSFDVSIDPDRPAELLRVDERAGAGAAADWRLHGFTPAEGYIAALAVRKRMP